MPQNLIHWDPFQEIQDLQNQFFNQNFIKSPLKQISLPATDIYTNQDKELVIEAQMPNFEQSDVDVHLENGLLIIRAEKHQKEQDKDKKYFLRESSSSFYRSIRLPKHADQQSINAEMHNGLLTVTVPFKEAVKPKKITVKAGRGKNKK